VFIQDSNAYCPGPGISPLILLLNIVYGLLPNVFLFSFKLYFFFITYYPVPGTVYSNFANEEDFFYVPNEYPFNLFTANVDGNKYVFGDGLKFFALSN